MAITLEEIAYRLLPRVVAGRALSNGEWKTLVRTAETLLEESAVRIGPEQVADNVERFLCVGRSRRAWRVRLLLTLIELLPLAHCGRPFSALAGTERRRWIVERWVPGGGLGGICARVRLLVLMGAYGNPRAFDDIGFVPIPLRPRFARQAQAHSPLRHEITTRHGSAAS